MALSIYAPGQPQPAAILELCMPRNRTDQPTAANHPGPLPPLQRDGCPKIINLGSAKTDLFYERKKYGCALVRSGRPSEHARCAAVAALSFWRHGPVRVTASVLPPSPAGA